jgi:hypothetical protein
MQPQYRKLPVAQLLPLALLGLLVSAGGVAAQEDDDLDFSSGGLGNRASTVFPFCRCTEGSAPYSCTVSPYSVGAPTVKALSGGTSEICWNLK